ncbi:MAG TPA: CDGSH iron-sulfur domain-containing protein [Oceanipulchritudo sp.]|nr:CDGSH iron-sulfur domain-containing protein [Oceanipulchritudo sp.]
MSNPIVANNKPVPVELEEGKTYFYCTCGQSAGQPFCDGSHKGSGMAPKAFKAEKTGTAYLCQCKDSQNAPFCDGSHKAIPADNIGKPKA